MRKSIRVRLGKGMGASTKTVDVVLAGNSSVRNGAIGSGTQVVPAADGEEVFAVTGDTKRNARVVVVNVDQFGVGFVRELRTVFPNVKIVALSNHPRVLVRAMKAGATVALPLSTPAPQLASVIRRLARSGR